MAGNAEYSRRDVSYGRYRGARRRQLVLSTVASVLLVVIGYSWLRHPPSIGQLGVSVMIVIAVFGLSEWLFVRRPGIEIQSNGLVLRGTVTRVTVPWDRVRGFTWRAARSLTTTQYLSVETDQSIPRRIPKDAPIRLPTIARSVSPGHLNDRLLGPLFTSPDLRSPTGVEVDAAELLRQAWAEGTGDRRP